MIEPLAAALEYAGRGWPCYPVERGGKRPLLREWPTAASTDPEQLIAWWTRWPDANLAIVTGGRSAVVGIDLDDDDVGGDAYGALLVVHGSPGSMAHPDGAAIRTGREGGGWRLLFRIPDGVTIRKGVLTPGVEFMGDGGSAIMPPSVHPSGRRYVWRDPIPADGLPELAPAWVELLSPSPVDRARIPAPAPEDFDGIGTRYGKAALQGECVRLAAAEVGTRNDALNTAAFAVGSLSAAGHLHLERAMAELVRVALGIGLLEAEIKVTVESGLRAGLAKPRRERAA